MHVTLSGQNTAAPRAQPRARSNEALRTPHQGVARQGAAIPLWTTCRPSLQKTGLRGSEYYSLFAVQRNPKCTLRFAQSLAGHKVQRKVAAAPDMVKDLTCASGAKPCAKPRRIIETPRQDMPRSSFRPIIGSKDVLNHWPQAPRPSSCWLPRQPDRPATATHHEALGRPQKKVSSSFSSIAAPLVPSAFAAPHGSRP